MRKVIGVVLLSVAVLGCRPAGGAATPATADSVPWSDYAPTVRTEIDADAAAKNCPDLQDAFNNAEANGSSMLSRTGHNNADLMRYIDGAMRAAGCYS